MVVLQPVNRNEKLLVQESVGQQLHTDNRINEIRSSKQTNHQSEKVRN